MLEVVLVTALMVGMIAFAAGGYGGWIMFQKQTQVQGCLNMIAAGQRNYLLANPTKSYSDITLSELSTWIPTGQMPTFPEGTSNLKYTEFPPTADLGGTTWTAKEY